MTKLTRAQLDALTFLHHYGRQWPLMASRYGGDRHTSTTRYSRRTLDALVAAGVATWAPSSHGVMPHIVPALHTWADGHGDWHVRVPRVGNSGEASNARRAIARAVIEGEVYARNGQAYIDHWRARVRVNIANDVPADVVEYVEA